MTPVPGQRGFTLIEVMVALLIFGMLASAGVAILSFSVRAQAVTDGKLDASAALNRTLSLLSADLAQAVPRAARDEGGTPRPAFAGEPGSAAVPMLRFVRGGWSNVDGAPRAGLQKVEYRVNGGALERIAYPMLDGAAPSPPAALVDHVRAATLAYRYGGAWSDRWDGAAGVPLPQALALTLQRDDGTAVRIVALVGTGYVPPPPPPPVGGISDAPG